MEPDKRMNTNKRVVPAKRSKFKAVLRTLIAKVLCRSMNRWGQDSSVLGIKEQSKEKTVGVKFSYDVRLIRPIAKV